MKTRRFILTMAIVLLTVLGVDAQKTYVLVTGVSSYQDSRNTVTQTTKNAKSFASKMLTQTPNVSVLTSAYANHDNVIEKLTEICKVAKSNDRIIFFFAGHGGVDNMQDGCIFSHDKEIYYSELMECFKASKAKEKIMFIEACHSGSSLSSYIDKSVICFSSSRMDEYSFYNDLIGAGYFSRAILTGLQGKADENLDKQITVMELFEFAYKFVVGKSNKNQHPQLICPKDKQDLVIFDCKKL